MSIENNELWNNFLNTYKTLVALWDVKSDKYKNRNEKNRAYETLLLDYKKIDKNADIAALKNRVHNMRTTYRRELRKQLQAEGTKEMYESSLWYFNNLHFLRGYEAPESGLTTVLSSDDESPSCSQTPRPAKKAKNEKKERQTLLRKASAHLDAFSQEKTDGEVFAQGWARSFDKLSPEQQFFAKDWIEEGLRLARLNLLSSNSTFPSPKLQPPIVSSRSSSPIRIISMVPLDDSTQYLGMPNQHFSHLSAEIGTSMPMHATQLSGDAGMSSPLRCKTSAKEYSGSFGANFSQ